MELQEGVIGHRVGPVLLVRCAATRFEVALSLRTERRAN